MLTSLPGTTISRTISLPSMNFCTVASAFAAAIIACTPIVPFVHRKLYEASKRSRAIRAITHVLEAALPSVLLMISICALAGDSFNPFMYLKF